MTNIEDYLGSRTPLQKNLILGVILLKKEGVKEISSEMVAKKTRIGKKSVGGAWTSITKLSGDMPPLLKRSRREIERDIEGKILSDTQYWKINEEINWEKIANKIKAYV